MKAILDFIIGIFGWVFYVSCIPGVALIYIIPIIFLIVSYKLKKEQPDKYEKLFKISLVVFLVCFILFIGLTIWTMLDSNNSYPVM